MPGSRVRSPSRGVWKFEALGLRCPLKLLGIGWLTSCAPDWERRLSAGSPRARLDVGLAASSSPDTRKPQPDQSKLWGHLRAWGPMPSLGPLGEHHGRPHSPPRVDLRTAAAPLAPRALGVLFDPALRPFLVIAGLGRLPSAGSGRLGLLEILVNGFARQAHFTRETADRLALDPVATTGLGDGVHA